MEAKPELYICDLNSEFSQSSLEPFYNLKCAKLVAKSYLRDDPSLIDVEIVSSITDKIIETITR